MLLIKVSESVGARRRISFEMISSSDFITSSTGLTFSGADIKVRGEGGTLTDFAGTVTEIGLGFYEYEFSTGEIATIGKVVFVVSKAGSVPYRGVAQIVAFDPYDSTRYGLSSLPNANVNASGGLITSGTGTGQLQVDGFGGASIALDQDVPATDLTSKTTQTVGDCLSAARAEGVGQWIFAGVVETIYGPDGIQIIRTFTLNDAINPTQRI